MKEKISTYAKKNDMSYLTVYNMVKRGELKSEQLPSGSIRIITENSSEINHNKVILYARVSSSENKSNLESQMKRLREYACAKGYTIIKEVKEVGSGLNDKRKQLESIFKNNDWSKIIVEHKDRLARFGINFIEILLQNQGKSIEIINEVESNSKEDIMQDFVSIITSFTARLYGLRRSKRKTEQIIKEIIKDNE
jgi:predicted site-specific integrase-resolvase